MPTKSRATARSGGARKSGAAPDPAAASAHDEREALTHRLIGTLQVLIADGVLRNELIARRLDMNVVDLQSLGLIVRGEVSTPGQLATRSGLPTSTATRILDRLEAKGMVRREADPDDRRRVRVVIARHPFADLSEDPYAEIVENLRAVHARFTPEELEIAARYLEALTVGPDGTELPADAAPAGDATTGGPR